MIVIALSGAVCGVGGFMILRTSMASNQPPWSKALVFVRQSRRADRAILQLSDESFAAMIAGAILLGVVASGFTMFALSLAGVAVPSVVVAVVVLCGTALSVALYLEDVTKKAARSRRTFSYALSSYLDLASVLLAGGAGSETALIAAASTGDSWSFRLIRETLEVARAGRTPSWQAFAALGRRLGVVDLERLAGSMQLAGEQGAKVRLSLATQADALRARQIAEVEADAQAATERMGVPTVLLFVGFIALLGYPALDLVVGQM